MLTHQAAAAVSVGTYWPWEPTARLPSAGAAVGSAARGASAPTKGGEWRSSTACFLSAVNHHNISAHCHHGEMLATSLATHTRCQSLAVRRPITQCQPRTAHAASTGHRHGSTVVCTVTSCSGWPPRYTPAPCKLVFELFTLKVVSVSRVTWATSVPILVFLSFSVLELRPMYATDVRQTDVRQKHLLMLPPCGGGAVIN